MSWLAIVFWVITNLPTLINIIQQIISLIQSMPREQRKAFKMRLSDAIKTGDKEEVSRVLHSVRDECVGVGCPPETKRD